MYRNKQRNKKMKPISEMVRKQVQEMQDSGYSDDKIIITYLEQDGLILMKHVLAALEGWADAKSQPQHLHL
jgi:hypothetical protein